MHFFVVAKEKSCAILFALLGYMDNNQPQQSTEQVPTYPARPTSKKSNRFVKIGALVLILVILFFGGKKILGSKSSQTPVTLSPSPSPTEFQLPTDTPAPSDSPTPAVTSTPTPKPTGNPVDRATGLDRSSVSVEVLNGSGIAGVAGKMSDTLKSFGYKVSSTGNADNFDFANTEIHVKSASSSFLSLIKSDLSSSYTIGNAASDLDSSAAADIRVIVGKQ